MKVFELCTRCHPWFVIGCEACLRFAALSLCLHVFPSVATFHSFSIFCMSALHFLFALIRRSLGVILFLATMSVSAFHYLWIWLFSGMGYHGRPALDSMKVLGKVFLDLPGWTWRMHFWSLCIYVFTLIDQFLEWYLMRLICTGSVKRSVAASLAPIALPSASFPIP